MIVYGSILFYDYYALVADANNAERLLMTKNWTLAGVLPNGKVVLYKRHVEKGLEPSMGWANVDLSVFADNFGFKEPGIFLENL